MDFESRMEVKARRFVVRQWGFWIFFWVAILGLTSSLAPTWDSVTSEQEFSHLPADAPTRVAGELRREAFPEDYAEASIVLILQRREGRLDSRDLAFVRDSFTPQLLSLANSYGGVIEDSFLQALSDDTPLETWFESDNAAQSGKTHRRPRAEAPEPSAEQPGMPKASAPPPLDVQWEVAITAPDETRILRIRTPLNSPVGPLLVSDHQQAMLMTLELSTGFLASSSIPLVDDIESLIERVQNSDAFPEGLEILLTGGAVVGRDTIVAVGRSVSAVRRWTVWLILGLVIAVFRAPLVSMVPLVTLYCAVEISINILAMLAQLGYIDVFDGLQIYTTVLVYGAGVDYALFLISRHKEELRRGLRARQAVVLSMTKVGAAVFISAATEILSIGMLSFTRFGKLHQAGIAIPVGLFITLAASFTLTPALLRLFGRWAFWPYRFKPRKSGTSRVESELGLTEEDIESSYLSAALWHGLGRLLERYPVLLMSGTVALLLPFAIIGAASYSELSYDIVGELPDTAPSRAGNASLQRYFSAGITGPTTLMINHPDVDFSSDAGVAVIDDFVTALLAQQEELKLADIWSVATPIGISPRAKDLQKMIAGWSPEGYPLLQDEQLINPSVNAQFPASLVENASQMIAYPYYVSDSGPYDDHVTRIILVFGSEPFSQQSIERLDRLRGQLDAALPPVLRTGSKLYLLGPTASLLDLKHVAEADRLRMYVLVTIVTLACLMLLLRRVAISIYLVCSVAFTYLVTLGITWVLFQYLEGEAFNGLEWTLPILLFTLLMAVGADYNVLFINRADEERKQHGATRGTIRALTVTGGLISGAGIIMAGTFSALIWGGSLSGMQQLGFGLACSVLIDTFVVRPILVPGFLLLVHTGGLGRLGDWLAK